jgi:hypothetical protein
MGLPSRDRLVPAKNLLSRVREGSGGAV